MREDTRCKRGETEDDAETIKVLARSRRKAEDGVYIAHGPTDGGSMAEWL